MRKLIATLAVMLIALPAGAATGDITRSDRGTPMLERHEWDATDYRYDIVGTFFVVVAPDGTETSFEVPADAVGYELHDDGAVTFTAGTVEPVTESTQIADVTAEEWEEYVEEGGDTAPYQHTTADVYPI